MRLYLLRFKHNWWYEKKWIHLPLVVVLFVAEELVAFVVVLLLLLLASEATISVLFTTGFSAFSLETKTNSVIILDFYKLFSWPEHGVTGTLL